MWEVVGREEGGKNEGQERKKYRAMRHVGEALEKAFNLSVNIGRTGLYMPSLKKWTLPCLFIIRTWG